MTNKAPMTNDAEDSSRNGSLRLRALWVFGTWSLTFSGCTVGPDYHPPQLDVPLEWVSTPGGPGTVSATTRPGATTQMTSSSRPSTPTREPAEVGLWWKTFNDPVLDSLIERALDGNLDVRQSVSRIRAARASRRFSQAGQWPRVDTSGAYRRARAPSTGG